MTLHIRGKVGGEGDGGGGGGGGGKGDGGGGGGGKGDGGGVGDGGGGGGNGDGGEDDTAVPQMVKPPLATEPSVYQVMTEPAFISTLKGPELPLHCVLPIEIRSKPDSVSKYVAVTESDVPARIVHRSLLP